MNYVNIPPKQPMFSKKFYDGGLLTLSTYEIQVTGFKPFKSSAGEDAYYHKGLSYSKIFIEER